MHRRFEKRADHDPQPQRAMVVLENKADAIPSLAIGQETPREENELFHHLKVLKFLQKSLVAMLVEGAANDMAVLIGEELNFFSTIVDMLLENGQIGKRDMGTASAQCMKKRQEGHLAIPEERSPTAVVADLTVRQRQVMELVLAGEPSKNIAADLGISQRTVENHRAAIMKKTCSSSIPALARFGVAAGLSEMNDHSG